MSKWIDQFIVYNKEHYHFTDYELAKIRYAILLIISELSKIIILAIFFLSIGYLKEFMIVSSTLLCVRSFAGGLHFQTYRSCLIFTFTFISSIMMLSHYILLNATALYLLLTASVLMNLLSSPVVAKQRPAYTKKYLLVGKYLSTLAILACTAITLYMQKDPLHPYSIYMAWTIFLQCIQLSIAKGVYLHERIISA